MTGAVEGGDSFLEIRRSLRALGFVAQLAQRREGRPPCYSTRKGHRALSHFPARPGELGRGSPHKALLTRLVESDPRAGANSWEHVVLQRGACFTPSCWNKYAGGLSGRLTEVCIFPWRSSFPVGGILLSLDSGPLDQVHTFPSRSRHRLQ